jgi:hypothetical protein
MRKSKLSFLKNPSGVTNHVSIIQSHTHISTLPQVPSDSHVSPFLSYQLSINNKEVK